MVLASRGWGVEEFRLASPEFLHASRWFVMAEKAVPVYQDQREVMAMSTSDIADPARRGMVARAKVDAADVVKSWTPWLFPEDQDG